MSSRADGRATKMARGAPASETDASNETRRPISQSTGSARHAQEQYAVEVITPGRNVARSTPSTRHQLSHLLRQAHVAHRSPHSCDTAHKWDTPHLSLTQNETSVGRALRVIFAPSS